MAEENLNTAHISQEPKPSVSAEGEWGNLNSSQQTSVLGAISAITSRIRKEESDLIETKAQLQDQLRNLYKDIEKTKYSVFSIIMHEGTADHGHYYCYIRGQGDEWFRFNDFHVRAATADEVFSSAFGGENSHASAYCVFYMREDIFKESAGHNFGLPSETQGGYYKHVSVSQLVPVISANQAFLEQVAEIRVKKVVAEYEKKWDLAKKRFGGTLKSEEIAKKSKVFGIRALPDYIYFMANEKIADFIKDNQI